jgi:ligand-binding sensor domain-containing protein/signal transduction histidine kinase
MIRLIFITLICFTVNPAFSQQLPFRNYTIKDGLSQLNVRTVFQDSKGFMWFGTWNGVDRYDGTGFDHFSMEDGLAHYLISHIMEDRSGTLWIATNFGGISKYEDGMFHSYAVYPDNPGAYENRVKIIFGLKDGTLFVGTDGGVFIFDGKQFTPRTYNVDLRPTAVIRDSRNYLWIGSGQGLCVTVTDTSSQCIVASDLEREWVNALIEDTDGTIWIGTEHGLRITSHIDTTHRTFITESPPPHLEFLADTWIRSLFLDNDGYLWIGTGGFGLYKVSPSGAVTLYTTRNGLAGDQIVSIFQDRERNLWFSTTSGVSKLVSKQLTNYTIFDGLPEQLVQCILEDNKGNIWIGTRLGLCILRHNSISLLTTDDGLQSDYLLALYPDHDGTIWAGTTGGPNKIIPTDGDVRIESFGEQHGWKKFRKTWENRARKIYRDAHGNLWFGNDIGIALLKDNTFIQFPVIDYKDRDLVVGIVMDAAGYLWVARFNSGISRYALRYDTENNITLEETARYGNNNGLETDRVQSVFKDRRGDLWFPTRHQGIYRFVLDGDNEPVIHNYTKKDGLVYNLVHEVFEDSEGRLWAGGGAGIDQIELLGDDIAVIRRITIDDGLAGEAVIGISEDSHGNIWFATSGGATRYDPYATAVKSPPPPVHITDFRIFGEPNTEALRQNSIRLPYDQHSVSFEFTGLGFKDESRIQYRYMLAGFDRDWSERTSRRYVNYTHLPSGTYEFRVIAQNSDGVWSDSPAVFTITIAAPFWRTWWFIVSAIGMLAGIVFLIHTQRLRRAVEIERMRSRIATDLHDDLGSTLSGISIFSEMGFKETEGKTPHAADFFRRIGESSQSMLDAMDDIVWAINPENDSLGNLVARMREFATELLEAKNITFTLNLPADSQHIKLSMNERRNIFLIFKEALHNLVRHSRCYSTNIELISEGNMLTLRIADDGIGMDLSNRGNGNGLKNLRKRSDAIGANLTVDSDTGKGTTITVTLKIT